MQNNSLARMPSGWRKTCTGRLLHPLAAAVRCPHTKHTGNEAARSKRPKLSAELYTMQLRKLFETVPYAQTKLPALQAACTRKSGRKPYGCMHPSKQGLAPARTRRA
jgi:hypothetical protein